MLSLHHPSFLVSTHSILIHSSLCRYAVPNKLPAKQVSILAHRKKRQNEESSHGRVKQLNRSFKLRKKPRGFIKAEAFVNKYRKAERDMHRMKRIMSAKTLFNVTDSDSNQLVVMSRPPPRPFYKFFRCAGN